MNTVNRALLIARPRDPFVAWVAEQAKMSPDEARVELDDARPAYLIPPYTPENDLDTMLGELCDEVFTCELKQWTEDEARWPEERALATFKQWFEVDLHSIVADLGDNELDVEAVCGEIGS